MEEAQLLAPLAFVIISLVAGALLKLLLTKINLPYTVGLFVLGLGVGILNLNGYLEATPVISASISMVCNIDPDMILNIFLPILIFSAAYELDIHVFKKTLTNATLLAVPGLIIAMFLTAALMMGIAQVAPAYAGWNWALALMFGALISATDPVAVVALLGELGVSKRFSTLIDGESMLNDGTGIVLFTLMLAPFTASVESADPSPVISFLVVVFGGLVIGYLMARAFLFYATRAGAKGDVMLQTSVMILLSYITFILAQDIFKLSGVIALVAFGLAVAYHGASKIDERAQHFMKEFWELLAYIANTLIFIIIGIIIAEKVDFSWTDLAVLLTVYVGINLVRMFMILILYPLLRRSGYGLSKRESVILTWGALRGALGLTLALIVTYTEAIPEDIRRQVLLLTAGIVTLTLVVNATTIKWLLNALGLLKESTARRLIAAEIQTKLHEKSSQFLDKLSQDESFSTADWDSVSQLIPIKADALDETPTSGEMMESLRMQIISAERQVVWGLFTSGVIAPYAQRKLAGALDTMVDMDGRLPLDKCLDELGILGGESKRRGLFSRLFTTSASDIYEVAYGVLVTQGRALEVIDNLSSTHIISQSESVELQQIRREIESIKSAARDYINSFSESNPEEYREATTLRAERMLLKFEIRTLEEFVESGLIESDAADALKSELAQVSAE